MKPSRLLLALLIAFAFGCGRNDALGEDASAPVQGSPGVLVPVQQLQREVALELIRIREQVANEKKVKPWQVRPDELRDHPRVQEILIGDVSAGLRESLLFDPATAPPIRRMSGFSRLDGSSNHPALGYTVLNDRTGETYVSLKEFMGRGERRMMLVRIANKQSKDSPQMQSQVVWYGPVTQEDFDERMKQVREVASLEVLQDLPVSFYASNDQLSVVVEGEPMHPELLSLGLTYYAEPPEVVRDAMAALRKDPSAAIPPVKQAFPAALRK